MSSVSAPVYTDAVELDEASRIAYEDACDAFEQRQLRIEEERFRVTQKIEQLKTVAELAAIIGGFGAMYLAQTTIPIDKLIGDGVLVVYGSLATVVVCTNIIAVLLCSFIMLAVLNFDCVASADSQNPALTFDHFWLQRCESDWILGYRCFLFSLPVFVATNTISASVQLRASPVSTVIAVVISSLTIAIGVFYVFPRWHHVASSPLLAPDRFLPELLQHAYAQHAQTSPPKA